MMGPLFTSTIQVIKLYYMLSSSIRNIPKSLLSDLKEPLTVRKCSFQALISRGFTSQWWRVVEEGVGSSTSWKVYH